jgi:DHA1 family solute carrier family 18 vesicular amine transporter 1/2
MGSRHGRVAQPRRALTAYVGALVVVDLAFATAIIPLLPHYTHAAALSTAGAGVLMAAYPVGGIVGAVPASLAAGRLGPRTAVLLGLVGVAGAALVLGWSTAIAAVAAARFAQGAAGACVWAGGLAWLAGVTAPERRGEALGVAMGFAAAGTLAGPAIGAFASWAGPGVAFSAAAAVCAVLMAAGLVLHGPGDMGAVRLLPKWRMLRDRNIAAGAFLTVLGGVATGMFSVLAPLRLSQAGAGALLIAGVFFAAGAVETALSPLLGRACDRRGEMAAARLLLAVGAIVSFMFPLLGQAGWLAVLLAVGLPAYGSFCVPGDTLLSLAAERMRLHQGAVFGLSSLAWAGGEAVATVTAGAVAQATSDVVPGFLLAGICLAAVVALAPGSPLRPLPAAEPEQVAGRRVS